jgi:two-component system, cell cycle sensor histidine kinase and response regulator CckA
MNTPTNAGMRRPVLSVGIVVAAGIAISTVLWLRERADIERDQQQRLAHLAEQVAEHAAARVGRIEQVLHGLRGLYAAHGQLDSIAWNKYLDQLPTQSLPGLEGFSYVRRVPREEEAAFVAEMRKTLTPDFAIKRQVDAPERSVIVLRRTQPPEPEMIGYDVTHRPSWLAIADFTRRTGRTALTAPIPSVKDPSKALLFVVLPLYRPDVPLTSDAERAAAHHGWVYAHVSPKEFLAATDTGLGDDLQLEIFDATDAAAPAAIYQANALTGRAGGLVHEIAVPLFNRSWRISAAARPEHNSRQRNLLAGQLFAGGLLATGLLATLMWNLGRTRRKATRLANDMTREMREQAGMLRHAQRIANLGVCYWDEVTGEAVRSEEYLRIFGLPPDTGRTRQQENVLAVIHPDDRARAAAVLTRAPRTHASERIVFRLNVPGHGERTILAEQGLLPPEDGQPGLALSIVHDITERVAADRALAESHAQLERLMSVLPGAVFQLKRDANGTLTLLFLSDGATRLFGMPASELAADCTRLLALFPSADHEALQQALATSANTLQPLEKEVTFRTPAGEQRWTRLHAIAERLTREGAVVWHGVAMDITAARGAEERLRFTQFALDHARDAVAFITPEGDRIYVNDETCRLTGYTREELLASKIWTTFTAFTLERYCYLWGVVKRQGTHIFEAALVAKSGDSRPVEVGVTFIDFGGREVVFAIARDISARKAAEQALRASEERLRLTQYALDHAQDIVSIMDRDGNRLHVNDTYCRYTGYSREELIASKVWDKIPSLNQERFQQLWDDIRRCGSLTFEIEVEAKTGEKKPLEVSASFLMFGGREAVCTVSRDLTARKAAELEKKHMEQQLRETQKLESLGVLAGGIAHDFNNLLTGILGNASLARDRLAPNDELNEPLRQIERASSRAAELCQQMLAYAGKGRFIVEPVDLSSLVDDTAKLLDLSVARRAILDLRLERPLPPVLADATQMRQIVMNLVLNAAEAIPHAQGRIVVTTGRMNVDRAFLSAARVAAGLSEGEAVFLEVTDNGSGMDRATLDRIFEPFFTTKFTGRGLGLAAVLGIVRSHQGVLHVQSEPGRGTTFRLVLAPHEGRPRHSASPFANVAPPTRKNHGRILVIDDEESVRSVTRQALERTGFTVEVAEDGETGLTCLRKEPEGFVLVLLDYTMPRLDGAQTLREIHKINPRARVIMMSGFSEMEARERLGNEELAGFIQKPFDLPTLRSRVEKAVNDDSRD